MNTINPLTTDWWRCPKCKESFLTHNEDPDAHLLKVGMRCPNFVTCKGRLTKRTFKPGMTHIDKARHISAVGLFQAAAGVGLPEERNCAVADIRKLLTGTRISAVHLEKAPDPKKSVLLSLTLETGKTIHLTTSTRGAMVYKVTDGR